MRSMSAWIQPDLGLDALEEDEPYCWQCSKYASQVGGIFEYSHTISLHTVCPAYRASGLIAAGLAPFRPRQGHPHDFDAPLLAGTDGRITHRCTCGYQTKIRGFLANHIKDNPL